MPKAQVAHLPVNLLVLARQDLLDQGDILGLQHIPDFLETHAQLLHVSDHIQTRILVDVVIPVAGLFIHMARLEQAKLIVETQRRHRNLIHFRHFADGKKVPLHDARLQTLMLI